MASSSTAAAAAEAAIWHTEHSSHGLHQVPAEVPSVETICCVILANFTPIGHSSSLVTLSHKERKTLLYASCSGLQAAAGTEEWRKDKKLHWRAGNWPLARSFAGKFSLLPFNWPAKRRKSKRVVFVLVLLLQFCPLCGSEVENSSNRWVTFAAAANSRLMCGSAELQGSANKCHSIATGIQAISWRAWRTRAAGRQKSSATKQWRISFVRCHSLSLACRCCCKFDSAQINWPAVGATELLFE